MSVAIAVGYAVVVMKQGFGGRRVPNKQAFMPVARIMPFKVLVIVNYAIKQVLRDSFYGEITTKCVLNVRGIVDKHLPMCTVSFIKDKPIYFFFEHGFSGLLNDVIRH